MKRADAQALVVFHGNVEEWWANFLRPGFRHCLIWLRHGDQWVMIEPLGRQLEIWTSDPQNRNVAFDPQIYYRKHGCHVVPVTIAETPKTIAPIGLCTCVEIVKRTIGIRSRHIITPYQLYCRLTMKRWHLSVLNRFLNHCGIWSEWLMLKETRD